jgi:hypothetical protein
MTKAAKPFATEAELCAAFIGEIGDAWTAYAETAGWDILLSRKVDGFQIGIEAKLKLNVLVINQALEQYSSWVADSAGPDCRAVLVPECDAGGFSRIADYIGLVIITMRAPQKVPYYHTSNFRPALPGEMYWREDDWHEWGHTKRYQLPEYVPDVAAGAPAPLQLTQWKIAAMKIAVTLERRGFVTRADFKHHNIDHRRWLTPGAKWLANDGGRLVASELMPNFKAQHPRVYAEIAADADNWILPHLI